MISPAGRVGYHDSGSRSYLAEIARQPVANDRIIQGSLPDAAFKALERAFEDRSQPLLNAWFVPEFKPLHDDPRYRELMDRGYASQKTRATP